MIMLLSELIAINIPISILNTLCVKWCCDDCVWILVVNWGMEICKIMIAMLDRSQDGMMQWAEFKELLQCLVYWHQTFCQFDVDRTGFIEPSELFNVIKNKFSK